MFSFQILLSTFTGVNYYLLNILQSGAATKSMFDFPKAAA